MCTNVNGCIPNHGVELWQSGISDVNDQSPFYGVNGVEAVSSRPEVVCRPIDCICVDRTPSISRGNFVCIQNFNYLVVYIIFNTYVRMCYVVFRSIRNGIAKWTFRKKKLPNLLKLSTVFSFAPPFITNCTKP